MSQSSKSSVTLGAVWWTLTLAGEEPRSRRSLHILHLGPNHLHLSTVLFIICAFFNYNVWFCCDLEDVHVKSCIIFFQIWLFMYIVVYNCWLFDTHNSVISMIFCRPCRFKDTIANEQYMQQLRIMISFSHSSFSIVGLQMISISFCRGRFAILKCHLSQRRQPDKNLFLKKTWQKIIIIIIKY